MFSWQFSLLSMIILSVEIESAVYSSQKNKGTSCANNEASLRQNLIKQVATETPCRSKDKKEHKGIWWTLPIPPNELDFDSEKSNAISSSAVLGDQSQKSLVASNASSQALVAPQLLGLKSPSFYQAKISWTQQSNSQPASTAKASYSQENRMKVSANNLRENNQQNGAIPNGVGSTYYSNRVGQNPQRSKGYASKSVLSSPLNRTSNLLENDQQYFETNPRIGGKSEHWSEIKPYMINKNFDTNEAEIAGGDFVGIFEDQPQNRILYSSNLAPGSLAGVESIHPWSMDERQEKQSQQ